MKPALKAAGATGAVTAGVIVWLWGLWKPDIPMPGEVAAGFGYLLGKVWEYASQFLPRPDGE